MEKIIQDAMNDDVLRQSAVLYGIKKENIKTIGGFENFVYEYPKDNQDYILRFVHSAHRSYDQVLAELEFIDYLDKNNARVSTVVHSNNDNLVERINLENNHYFTVCAFEKAPGKILRVEDLTKEFNFMFGKEVGRLHKLTKSYKPVHKRSIWYEENFLHFGNKFLPEKDQIIAKKLDDLVKKIKNLPQNIDNFGLIHTDLHFGNMLYSSGKLTFFDWDDSSYKHFISDIAIIIFYRIVFMERTEEGKNELARQMLAEFLDGYRLENSIDISFLKNLNDFLMLRTIILYIVLYAAGEGKISSPWVQAYINQFRQRIIDNTPFLNLEIVLRDL